MTSEPARRRGERGVALLLVLWIFMGLGGLALDFARYMRDDVLLRRIVTNLAQVDPTASMDRHTQEAIDTVVDSILDWRDHDNLKRPHGAESAYYLKRHLPYRAKNAFFDSPDELLLVRGVTADLFYGSDGVPGLRDIFSVYNRFPKISLDTAPPAVFQALLGIDAAATADLIAQRDAGVPIRDQVTAQLASIDPVLVALVDASATPAHLVTIDARGDLPTQRNQPHVQVGADLAAPATEETRIIRCLDRAPWDARPPGPPAAREKS